ncbi:hypothetical protein [Herpetosiphon giganteus]|uniref:hypothetical protein n=1 Tax=Herpetosiphon giganteus TaxID=2029754 RepID=UPI0019575F5A|nr:hypothetical protein [Herpetosiphon giganteus]MBM7841538.1 uncharacterized membrane protein (UPF0136 family) [Herpetosiphon giganteus]
MQCPACAMTLATASANCPYCGKQLNQPKSRANLLAFGASMFVDALLMLGAIQLGVAQRDSDGEFFRMLTIVNNPSSEWPALWTNLSYGYLIVALLAFLCTIGCLISQNRNLARGAMLAGIAGVVILAIFGADILFNDSGYSPTFGLWLGLFGSFTLTTTSTLFQVVSRK